MAGFLLLQAVLMGQPVAISEQPASLNDLHNFPPLAVARSNLELCNRHVAYLEAMGRFNAYWREENGWRLERARERRELWESLERAHNGERNFDSWRLDRLERLKVGLGKEAYYAGRMPSPIP